MPTLTQPAAAAIETLLACGDEISPSVGDSGGTGKRLLHEVCKPGPSSSVTTVTSLDSESGEESERLLLDLTRPPRFYKEAPGGGDGQTANYIYTTDFTNGQASQCSRHVLYFPHGALSAHAAARHEPVATASAAPRISRPTLAPAVRGWPRFFGARIVICCRRVAVEEPRACVGGQSSSAGSASAPPSLIRY